MSYLIRQLLLEVIQERSWSLSAVSRCLTKSADRSRLSKILRAKRPLSIDELHRVLKVVGEPERVFWRRYLALLDGYSQSGTPMDVDPGVIMQALAGSSPRMPAVVRELDDTRIPRLQRDVSLPLPPRLFDLDRLRLQDRYAALERGEVWVTECMERILTQRYRANLVTDLAAALGFWASSARTAGHSRSAAAGFALAFRVCGPARSSPQYAYLLWRSSHVLIDSGFPNVAQSFVERSYALFDIRGDSERAVNVLLSLGGQAIYTGRWSLAQCSFERCLSQTGVSNDQKAAAISNLAALHDRLGAFEKVLELLDEHQELLSCSQPRYRTSAKWIKARALAQGNGRQQSLSNQLFNSIRSDVARYCEPVDPFILFCDHATLLIRLDDPSGLRKAAGAVAALLPRLESTRVYDVVLQQVVDVLGGTGGSADSFKELREQISRSDLSDR